VAPGEIWRDIPGLAGASSLDLFHEYSAEKLILAKKIIYSAEK
jgi:hypothetical protein